MYRPRQLPSLPRPKYAPASARKLCSQKVAFPYIFVETSHPLLLASYEFKFFSVSSKIVFWCVTSNCDTRKENK